MFTGLIEELGEIKSIKTNKEGKNITFSAPKLAQEVKIDDSIAINGVCQTVVAVQADLITVQAIHVTLEKTTFNQLQNGDQINLELAMKFGDRLGGHLVQGHVNGTGKVLSLENTGKNWLVWISIPKKLRKYFISEGSIAVDGTSLTIAYLKDASFCISIIPHTYDNTIIKNLKIGSQVNLETDFMAKYVENFFVSPDGSAHPKIDKKFLNDRGFNA